VVLMIFEDGCMRGLMSAAESWWTGSTAWSYSSRGRHANPVQSFVKIVIDILIFKVKKVVKQLEEKNEVS